MILEPKALRSSARPTAVEVATMEKARPLPFQDAVDRALARVESTPAIELAPTVVRHVREALEHA